MSEKTCPSGKPVMTRRDALARARWMRTVEFATVEHYQCGRCKGWHIRRYMASKSRRR